jgi:hypothetical protein
MAIQLRRGTNQERLGITLVEGEVVYVTDFELTTIEVTSVNSTTNTLTTTLNHGLAVNDQIRYQGVNSNGLVEGTVYWVKAIPSQTDFTLSTSQGGTILDITGTATSLIFAVGPTDAAGVPYGYSISALYVGDGVTAGGNPAGSSVLDDLYDVTVGVYGNVGQYGQALRNGDVLVYNDVTNQWENTNVISTNIAANRLVAQFDSSANEVNTALIVRKNYGATNYGNNDGVGIRFELMSNSQGEDEIALISAVNTSGGINVNFSTTTDDGANYVTPLTLNTNGSTFNSDVNITAEALRINSDNSGHNGAIYFNGSNGTIAYNRSTNFIDFGNNIARGDTYISSGAIATGTGALNLNTPSGQPVNVQRDLVVGGNLTVNGTTTTVNSTTLTVDDKNIELAATATPSDTTADGGGITLKGNTDKKIFWDNATDRWYFDNGDGVNSVFVRNLTDINNVETTTFNKGDMFYYDGTNWVNDNKIQADTTGTRAVFQYNNDAAGVLSSALFVRKNFTSSDFAAGDGTGIGIQLSNDNGDPTTFATYSAIYSTTNPQIALRTSTDSFASNAVTVATIDSTDVKFNGTNLTLNANGAGSAGVDAQFTVERGTSGDDAYIKWDHSDSQWFIGNQTQIDGRLSVIGSLFTENGGDIYVDGTNIVLNNANPAASCSIQVSRPSNTVAIRWNESNDRWETTTNGTDYIAIPNQGLDTGNSPTFLGVTGGNVRVGITGDNEIDTSTGNLTIDSAGGTITVDDNLIVNENLTVNGNTTLGTGAIDTVDINCGEVNIGITVADVAVVIGNAATDSLTVNATSTFNNNVTVGSSSSDTLTVNSEVANNIIFNNNGTTTNRGVMGTVSSNDHWFVGGAATTSNNTGYMVIATGDDGTEPIYVRQYNNGTPLAGTTFRELTLLNGSGDTALPGQLRINGNVIRSDTDTTAITLSGANVTIAGDLTVNGTTTTINSTTLDVDDKNITIAKGAANAAAADGGGITLEGPATAATILYEADDDSWNLNKNTNVAGDFTAPTASINSYFYEDAAGDQIAAAIARTFTTTSTTITTIANTTRIAMKVMIVADNGTDTQCIEAMVMRDAGETSGAQVTFYAELNTGTALATFTADYDNGNIRLRATPASSTSTTFKVVRTALF